MPTTILRHNEAKVVIYDSKAKIIELCHYAASESCRALFRSHSFLHQPSCISQVSDGASLADDTLLGER